MIALLPSGHLLGALERERGPKFSIVSTLVHLFSLCIRERGRERQRERDRERERERERERDRERERVRERDRERVGERV